MAKEVLLKEYSVFWDSLKKRIGESKFNAIRSINKELILLYHHIGTEILVAQKEHKWGAKVIDRLSKDLKSSFPSMKGVSTRNLKYMRLFAKTFPEAEFVQQLVAQLPWGHIVNLIDKVKDKKEREFYIKKAIQHGWSRSVMIHQIELNLYARQGKVITNFKDNLPLPQSELVQQTLKDPYIFDFLDLGEEAHEREIEKELVKHVEKFLLELGAGFAFVGRQYHLEIGDSDFYIDLLFYHLKLRCYVVIELLCGAPHKISYVAKPVMCC